MKLAFTSAVALSAIAAYSATIEISQDRNTALYRSGEEAVFTVSVKDDDGSLLKEGTARWSLDNFGTVKYSSSKADLSKGNPFTVKGKMDEEGFLRLQVNSGTNSRVWAVGYDVEKIRQNEPCPADFDEYWASEKARLEREVPLDPKMTLDPKLSANGYNTYRVNFATFNSKRVYGFLCVPKDMSKAPFRLNVKVPGAGPGFITCGTDPDTITLAMNVHTFEPEATSEAQREHMNRQNRALAEKFGLSNKYAYCAVAGISSSREDYWYHDVMLGINRAVDWVCKRPDVDLGRVTYVGSSQGGGFGLFLNYLNPHFTKAFVAVCAITGHFGYRQNRQDGWPRLIRGQKNLVATEKNAAYFDGVNFASRIKHPICFIVGFADTTCPPAAVYAAYNACPSKNKIMINAVGSGHSWHKWSRNNKNAPTGFDYEHWLKKK